MFSVFADSVLIGIGINMLLALGLYFTLATGQFSVGHGGFMAIGAYAASILTVNFAWPLVPAVLCGGVAAFAIGVLIGLPGLRFSHLYLVMATFRFGQICHPLVWGAMLAAAVLSLLPDLFRFLKDWYLFMYGLLFVLLMIFRPQGMLDRAALRALRKKLWR